MDQHPLNAAVHPCRWFVAPNMILPDHFSSTRVNSWLVSRAAAAALGDSLKWTLLAGLDSNQSYSRLTAERAHLECYLQAKFTLSLLFLLQNMHFYYFRSADKDILQNKNDEISFVLDEQQVCFQNRHTLDIPTTLTLYYQKSQSFS